MHERAKKLLTLLLSFQGRIARQSFQIGSAILLALAVVGSFLIHPDAFFGEDVVPITPQDTIWQLCTLIPLTAVSVKRFNDRDWPWWVGYVPALLSAALTVANQFRYLLPEKWGTFSPAEKVTLSAICFVVLLAFADNAFVRGTAGPNRYGPDPLQKPEQTRE